MKAPNFLFTFHHDNIVDSGNSCPVEQRLWVLWSTHDKPTSLLPRLSKGLAVLGHEACAATHGMTREGGLQLRLLPGPVQHVRAGDMDPGKALSGLPLDRPLMCQDVVQVIGTIKIESPIRVCRPAIATRMHKVEIEGKGIGLIRSDGLGRADKSGNQSSRQQGLRKRKVKEVV